MLNLNKLLNFWKFGRAARLRLFLVGLIALTALYIVYNIVEIKKVYDHSVSLSEFLQQEWKSGGILTEILDSGAFQFFILAMGWTSYLRLRQREMTQLRLRRSEQKYRTIINHAGEAIFLLDEDGRVLEWNKAAERVFSLPRRNVLNRRIQELTLGLDLDLGQTLQEIGRVQSSLTYETQVRRRDLQDRPTASQLSLAFSRIAPGPGPVAEKSGSFVVIARDITSEKQLESRMSETEKLAGIGQLAAGIAHQLNTPLGSILLSAQMLEEAIRNEDDAEDIRRIIRQTEQCRGIIKGLLNFARPTGSERGRMNLAEAIQDTVYLMEKNLKVGSVEVDVLSSVDPWVFGNRNEMEQVFFNLLANALDALPGGGRIEIRIDETVPGEIRVRFKDDGEGIPPDQQDRVFLPFFTPKDYGKGTGLGLSIVARIVHEHGGHIELESSPGKGTVFTLTFPRARDGRGLSALIEDGASPPDSQGA